jgi:hypothetical protein
VSTSASRTAFAGVLVALAMLAGCSTATEPIRGYNLLQHRAVALGTPAAAQSMRALKATGANTVAFVPFIDQPDARHPELLPSRAVTDAQLRAGIRQARAAGLRVMLKPQLLVADSWAGGITLEEADWSIWFGNYRRHLLGFAEVAAQERVDAFIVGTELSADALSQPGWAQLIDAVKAIYPGPLSYAAHNAEGVARFLHWDRLDAVGVTLYPAFAGDDPAQIQSAIESALAELLTAAEPWAKPVWILEVGMPSATGSLARPWDWRRLSEPGVEPDPHVQARVLERWLDLAEHAGVDALLVWAWFSDPSAGGTADVDYTPQRKPAEAVIRCRWTGRCEGLQL